MARDGEALHVKTERLRRLMADKLRYPVRPHEAVRSALELGLDRLIETYESGAAPGLPKEVPDAPR